MKKFFYTSFAVLVIGGLSTLAANEFRSNASPLTLTPAAEGGQSLIEVGGQGGGGTDRANGSELTIKLKDKTRS